MLQYNFHKFLLLSSLFLFIIACKPTGKITKIETNIIAVDTTNVHKEDSVALLIIAPYKQKIEAEMNQIIGYTTQAMEKGKPESLLNNFISDLILKKSNDYYLPDDGQKIDICILNTGGLRASLPMGAIMKSNIFDLMPFDNKLVVITLNGDKTKEMFDYIVAKGGEPISGFKMGIKDTMAINIIINDKPFDKSKIYKIVTSDYLANGGDKMTFFNNPIKIETLNHAIRDVIIEYFIEENIKGNKLGSKLDKRIYYE
jgi:2',3'-cyclic-nucleotide 2'-phosphodiesterase (5'-nucleotidase family)